MAYTVKRLATLAGVSIRTLHYYDEIGLLKPESVRPNGYREYADESLLKLQQIRFYRELGLSLGQIKAIVTRPDFDALSALESHRQALQGQVERLGRLLRTVDDTILHLKGRKEMDRKQLFEAFSEEQQEQYAKEAEQMYDPEIVRASQKKWKSYTAADKQRIGDEGNAAYQAIVAAIPLGPSSPEAQAGVERWRRHMDSFWTPGLEQLLGLAELYNNDPRFKANFDKVDPRLAEFMRAAVTIYVERKK
ncbi:MAG: MerR family transcriptional regulator [Anaerolineales bacterium]|nr:MerR family transcriptional regulator [Anaerolineales bacterium]